jgi:hypothetical protein
LTRSNSYGSSKVQGPSTKKHRETRFEDPTRYEQARFPQVSPLFGPWHLALGPAVQDRPT